MKTSLLSSLTLAASMVACDDPTSAPNPPLVVPADVQELSLPTANVAEATNFQIGVVTAEYIEANGFPEEPDNGILDYCPELTDQESSVDDLFNQADMCIKAGILNGARVFLSEILYREPENSRAKSLLESLNN